MKLASAAAAYALFPDFAEIKRMYVRQACRGQGIADAIVARLEAEVLASGLTLVRLETGVRQPAGGLGSTSAPAFIRARHLSPTLQCRPRRSSRASSWKRSSRVRSS